MVSLVIAEHRDNALIPATLSTLSAAKAMNDEVHMLIMGSHVDLVALSASRIQGVSAVYIVDTPIFEHILAENVEQQILHFLHGQQTVYQAILFPASTFGKNCAPRVAAKLDVFQISDITEVVDSHTFKRPIYAGNAIATVRSEDQCRVITVRPSAFPPAETGGEARIESVAAISGCCQVQFVGQLMTRNSRPDLQSAKIVVSGGRALGSAQAFADIVDRLADKFGAAVGASRAAVDAGYAPNDYQVGQTGKVVAPKLYIALGISGAIQHLAGMKEAGIIVAINKDPDAPIFAIANYGLVADIFDAVPELLQKI